MTDSWNNWRHKDTKKQKSNKKDELWHEIDENCVNWSDLKTKYVKMAKKAEKSQKTKGFVELHIGEPEKVDMRKGKLVGFGPHPCSRPTDTGVRDSKGRRLILDPNQAFRLHKRGSMDRLKVKSWHEISIDESSMFDRR